MNPFDKYNSESELPRLTDDIIKKKLKSMLRMSMGTFLMVLFSALVTGALLTGTAMHRRVPLHRMLHSFKRPFSFYPSASCRDV